jgi:serine/threonine protein kinase
MLGRGAFGKVNLAMHKLVRKLVALKSLNKEIFNDKD